MKYDFLIEGFLLSFSFTDFSCLIFHVAIIPTKELPYNCLTIILRIGEKYE